MAFQLPEIGILSLAMMVSVLIGGINFQLMHLLICLLSLQAFLFYA